MKWLKNCKVYKYLVIETAIERFSAVLAKSDEYTYFRVVYSDDIGAYIGTMYLKAAFRVNLLNRSRIWNHKSAHYIFSATISEKRFEFISGFITFDDKTSRAESWELFEQMNENNVPDGVIHQNC